MANITRRQGSPAPLTTRSNLPSAMDPLRLFRDLLRWDPFAEMMPAQLEQPLGNFVPNFEIRESDDAYVFKADLPGVADEDLDISITGNRLTVSGKREAEAREESDRFYAFERMYGSFSRSFTLPEQIDSERVDAALDAGVLTITVPKRPEAQPKKISVGKQAAAAPEQKPKPKA
jgi:HSP20 family protein